MKLLMMGTGPYAVPTLRALYESPHDVVALFTRPDVATSSRRKLPPNPMRELARRHSTPVYEPSNTNSAEAHDVIRAVQPDLMIVCDYGQILAAETLSLARHGGFNLHASLLPKYGGAAPINWAIYHGETETGNTVIHMTPRVDAGPCIAQQRIAIDPVENAVQLELRLAESGAALVLDAVSRLASGSLTQIPQDAQQVSRAPKLKKSDGQVDWSRSAKQICNQIRALQPWPKTYTHWLRDEKDAVRLILEEAHVQPHVEPSDAEVPPGSVILAAKDQLLLATGDALLAIDQLQPSGKRPMTTAEFLRGHPIRTGDKFA